MPDLDQLTRLTLRDILRQACLAMDVEPDEVLSRSRTAPLSSTRKIFILGARNLALGSRANNPMTFSTIAEALRRDTSTTIHQNGVARHWIASTTKAPTVRQFRQAARETFGALFDMGYGVLDDAQVDLSHHARLPPPLLTAERFGPERTPSWLSVPPRLSGHVEATAA